MFKFIRKLWFYRKLNTQDNLSFKMRMFLLLDYFHNINLIKVKHRLKFRHYFIDNYKIDQKTKKELLTKIELMKKEKRKQIKIEKTIEINVKPVNMKEELREIYWKMLQAKLNKFKMFFHKIYRMFNIKYLLDLKNSQDNIQKFFHFLSENIKIYKKSLEELVEGHREVTYNKDFKFQDGQTVQNKIDKVNE